MFITMLKNQRVTFVSDVAQAEKNSPFKLWLNDKSGKYVVSLLGNGTANPVAAGMELDEAQACVMFKANEYIFRNVQKGN